MKENSTAALTMKQLLAAQNSLRQSCPQRAKPKECEVARYLVSALIHVQQEEPDFQSPKLPSGQSVSLPAAATSLTYWLYTKDGWNKLDVDKNGTITPEELDLAELRWQRVWPGRKHIFPVMDVDKDSVLSRADLRTFTRSAVFVQQMVRQIDSVSPGATLSEQLYKANMATMLPVPVNPALPMIWKMIILLCLPPLMFVVHNCIWYGPAGFGITKKSAEKDDEEATDY